MIEINGINIKNRIEEMRSMSGKGVLKGMNEEMNPHSKPVMRMVICPLNGWHPLSACNICEHHLGIHTNVDTLESEVSCGYIAANVCEGE